MHCKLLGPRPTMDHFSYYFLDNAIQRCIYALPPIDRVRYINILTWFQGFQDKIANLLSFFCLSVPKRDIIGYKEHISIR